MSMHKTDDSDLDSSPLVSPNKKVSAYDLDISKLKAEYPSFSETLIRAYYKTNSYSYDRAKLKIKSYMDHKNQTMRLSSLDGPTPGTIKKSPIKKETIFGKYKFNYDKNKAPLHKTIISDDDDDDDDEDIIQFGKAKKRLQLNRFHNTNEEPSSASTSTSNKKRKLIRSDRFDSKQEDSEGEQSAEETDNEDHQENDLEDGEDQEYEHLVVSKKPKGTDILKFLNKANDKDIADIADIHINQAREIIKKRPYTSIRVFTTLNFPYTLSNGKESTTVTKKGRAVKPDGEKIYDRALQTIQSYDAIESLIKKCSKYGDLIGNEIKKWGVNVESGDSNNDDGPGMDFLVVNAQNNVEDEDAAPQEELAEVVENNDDDDETDIVQSTSKKSKRLIIDIDDDDDEEREHDDNDDDDFKGNDEDLEADDEDFVDPSDENGSENDDMDDGDYDENYDTQKSTSGSSANADSKNIVQHGAKSTKFFNKPPKYLDPSIQLKDYQLSGINWLYLLYCNNMSCILADEMGLGKTCQVISFLAYLKQLKINGPHLIVVPSSTLENWLREFAKFCPKLKVQPYYGTQGEREELREILRDSSQYDVLVTTYNLASGNKYDQHFLTKRNFNCVVFDEGHMLKNSMSERFDKLIKIKANFRLLLTGTPLQNNLKELMSLLNFIMPNLFTSQRENLSTLFKQKASTTVDKGYNPLLAQEAITRAKVMMKPFILRRRKQQVLKHLPPKHIKVIHCDMVEHQKEVYDKQLQKMIKIKNLNSEGADGEGDKKTTKKNKEKKQSNVNHIMALRKAAIHPLLFRDIYDDQKINQMSHNILQEPRYLEDGNQSYIREDMSYMNDGELNNLCHEFPRTLKKFKLNDNDYLQSGKLQKLMELLKEVCIVKNEKILVFSMFTQVLDIVGKVLDFEKLPFLRLDGSTSVNDRQSLIDEFYDNPDIKIFILSTKAGGFGINLVAANNVVIFDQSFNPHDDAQAMDRAHRVGQTKDVSVYTLITKNSIEEQIYKLAQNKLQLDSHISSEQQTSEESSDSDPNKNEVNSKINNLLKDVISTVVTSSSEDT